VASAALATVLLFICASTAAASHDTVATQRYLRAELTELQAELSALPAREQLGEAFVARVAGECGGLLSHAPKRASLLEIGAEVGGALGKAIEAPGAAAEGKFATAVGSLRWSNASITEAVARLGQRIRSEASLPVPELCPDLHSWVASGYEKVPAVAERYFRSVGEAGSLPSGSGIRSRLRHYETRSLRSLAKQVAKVEHKLELSTVPVLVVAVSELDKALGVPGA
jgi:hypothetical protein